jgi:hypothetical protein
MKAKTYSLEVALDLCKGEEIEIEKGIIWKELHCKEMCTSINNTLRLSFFTYRFGAYFRSRI